MKNSAIYNWYKASFEELSDEPSQELWGRISQQLDEMDVIRRGKWLRPVVGVVSALVFLSGVLINFAPTGNILPLHQVQKGWVSENSGINGGFLYAPASTRHPRILLGIKSPEIYSEKAGNPEVVHPAEKTIPSIPSDGEKSSVQPGNGTSTEAGFVTRRRRINLPVELPVQKTDARGEELPYVNSRNVSSAMLPTGIYAGITRLINSAWTLNHKTWEGFSRDGLTENIAVSGFSWGMITGVNLSDRQSVQVEFFSNNSQGQAYRTYRGNRYVKSETLLRYSKFNIIYKKKYAGLWMDGKLPVSFNLLAGPYYANLELLIRKEDDRILTHQTEYLDYDLGINAGAEFEACLSKRWVAHAGLRTTGGLINIYKGTDKVPASFNRTHNFTIGADCGIKYFISP